MDNFKLEDGREVRIEELPFDELEELARSKASESFDYLNPEFVGYIKDEWNKYRDEDEKDLSQLEGKPEDKPNMDYHKTLVAKSGEEVLGVLICEWNNTGMPFWRYSIADLEVHQGFRGQGIATKLISTLDNADFLKGKILQRGTPPPKDKGFISLVLDGMLEGKNYALIPYDYQLFKPPTEVGVYNRQGKLE